MKMYGKKAMALVLALAMMLSCGINVFAWGDYEADDIVYTMDLDEGSVNLEELVEEELADQFEWDDDDLYLEKVYFYTDYDEEELDNDDLDYGKVKNKKYTILIDEDDFDDEDDEFEEETIYYDAQDSDGDWYYGEIEITIVYDYDYDYDLDEDLVYELDYKEELYLGRRVKLDVEELLRYSLDYVVFDVPSGNDDCGELYYYDGTSSEIDDEKYYAKPTGNQYSLEKVYFESNSDGGEFFLCYTAYDVKGNDLEGTITISCGEALVVEVDIDSDDTYTFDPEDFLDAVEEWDDRYTLNFIEKVKLENSRDGELYDTAEKAISTKTEYYVANKTKLIEEITFEPSKRASSVSVSFTANVQRGNRKAEDVPGVLKINVGKAADIVIKAGVGDTVEIDWELFQDYLEDTLDSTKYEVAYVTITNAPKSAENGYLVTDGDELKTRSVTFYKDPSRTQNDLEDLQYLAGNKKGTHKATFKVYYDKSSTSTPNYVAAAEGTIKFEVTATTSISTVEPLKASKVMSFMYELAHIQNLGGNNNEYIQFTSLPINGKLYYDFGTSSQQDVTIGKDYYLTAQSGKLQLSRVTYVPSYSSSKVIKYDTIAVQCFDKKDNGVKGSINIAIQHAQYSAQFTDVKDAKYADSVDYLYNQKITTGMTANTFGLTEKVTRGQFVTFLYRAAGSPAVTGVTNKFTDVKAADYYYNAVLWAVKNGITSGRSATTFDPTAPVTHQELLTFLYRYDVNYLGHYASLGSASYVYDYASVDSWAQNAVKWAVGKNVVDYGNLLPKDAGTRATVALWLHRMLTL